MKVKTGKVRERYTQKAPERYVKEAAVEEEAKGWLTFASDVRHAKLDARGWHEHAKAAQRARSETAPTGEPAEGSVFEPGLGAAALAHLPAGFWAETKRAHVERLLRHRRAQVPKRAGADDLPGAGVPGATNWVPIGPSVVRRGQASGSPPISGRVARIAIAPAGSPMYIASADGGVWRSDDSGSSWKPTMDGFDLDPTAFAATSNCCGCIAIDPADPNRIYVGTGEGDVNQIFSTRLLTSLPAYRGIGPIRSDDGGAHWSQEPTDAASPTLVGAAFFELAVDPGDRENVVAATNVGLYHRVPDGLGGYDWTQVRPGGHTSVVACRVGTTTTFFAAAFGGGVFSSPDGVTWSAAGTAFPAGAGRISLGVRQTDPAVLYAFIATSGGSTFLGLSRLDGGAGAWVNVSGLPSLGTQSSYNLAIAVDPNDANTVYLAGSAFGNDGSVYRCAVTTPAPGTYTMATTFIGAGVHADVHALVHVPGDSNTLFVGCDGGVFRTTTATAAVTFAHRNTGLATLCCDTFGQHPTQLAVALVALQDNGTARYTGEEAWTHIADGDGGTPIVDWADPNKVICKINKNTFLATDGGQSTASLSPIAGGDATGQAPIFGAPIVTTPYDPANPTEAGLVAFGFGRNNYGEDLYISSTFGAALGAPVATLPERIFALCFASATRLYVGTTGGQVYRFDLSMGVWGQTRIDNAAGGALPLAGLITDIEVDPTDATGASIFISFGGIGDQRHIWHYDGTAWASRSGGGMNALLDSSHNAIVADPANPTNIYAAADIGVWQSTDSGMNWAPMQNGLPDAPVFDLQLHSTGRLLRAATHGRGMFEFKLDPPIQADVELYARDTTLDVGRASTVDGLADPETWPAQIVLHYLSRNIKVDVPTPMGYQTPSSNIDFLVFNDTIIDGSSHVATIDPAMGTVTNRVYVEVHNRGVVVPPNASVMLLVANASAGLPLLPVGYETNVTNGTPVVSATWNTVGTAMLSDVRNNFPRVAEFNLPSTLLPPPASLPGQGHWCALAVVHSPDDPFTGVDTNADNLTIADRKVAQHNLELVAFVGSPPAAGEGSWAELDLFGTNRDRAPKELVIDARAFNGRLGILLAPGLHVGGLTGLRESSESFVKHWATKHQSTLRSFIVRGRYSARACRQMLADIRYVTDAGRPILLAERAERKTHVLSGLTLELGKRYPTFLYFEPRHIEDSERQVVHVIKRDAKTHRVEGGCTYQVVLVKKPER